MALNSNRFGFILCVVLLKHVPQFSSQPAFVYDGTSTVIIEGQYNWTLKYPLGFLCEDPNWIKTLIIDIDAVTTSQADLIMAFGTSTRYFALALAYDGGLWVHDSAGVWRQNYGGWVAPFPGMELYSTPSLEQQYATSNDFRQSLLPGTDEGEWYPLGPSGSDIALNIKPLNLTIFGDRTTQRTQLTLTKGQESTTVEYLSTWPVRDTAYFFMGMDWIHTEQFRLRSIQSVDECTIQTVPTAPTTPSPTQGTMHPSTAPNTISPTQNPSLIPTQTLSYAPTDFPSVMPTKIPRIASSDPSVTPSREPSASPTLYPTTSLNPTDYPTHDPSMPPSRSPAREREVDEATTDVRSNYDSQDEQNSGGEMISFEIILIGVAGAVCVLICVVVLVVIFMRRKKKKDAAMHAMFGVDSEEVYSDDTQMGQKTHAPPQQVLQMQPQSNGKCEDREETKSEESDTNASLYDAVITSGVTVSDAAECSDCGLMKPGKVFEEDQLFYCFDCFESYTSQ
eukprot:625215_1